MFNFLKNVRNHFLPLNNRATPLAFYLLLSTFYLAAQPKDNSPYSRYGLGEAQNHSLSSAGFGGLSAAYADSLHVNLLNPASYGWLYAATFEAGLYADYSTLKYRGEETNVRGGNLSHLALAFPVRNPLNDIFAKKQTKLFWGMNIALLPNTQVGYNIQTDEIHPVLDSTINIFQGTGGTNKLVWGNGFRVKKFAFGLNLGYLFGQVESERRVVFRSLDNAYADRFIDNVSIKGFVWNLGGQYRYDLKKKKKDADRRSIIAGLYGNSATNFKTRSEVLRIRENFSYSPIQSDTLLSAVDVDGKGKLPAEWTLGFTYEQQDKLRIGVEYSFAKWSKYRNDAKPETLFDSGRTAIGVEYVPDASSYNKYLRRIRYQLGYYRRSDPRLENLDQSAVTLGFGLPLVLPRQQSSFINVAFEFGQFNTPNDIKENYVKMSLGFSLNDNSWFVKRKFG